MKRIATLLSEELLSWPDVSARPMFGMRAIYRGAVVFAMLPDRRALESPNAIAYKLPGSSQTREGRKWRLLELRDESDLSKALAHLQKAYEQSAG